MIHMYNIIVEDIFKLIVQPQRRLSSSIQEIVHKEVLKLLNVRIIYPILNSIWVSLVQGVLKKGGINVIKNNNNKLIPTRTIT